MRDAREALRYRVDALEQELAEKEAEIARLKAEAQEQEGAPETDEEEVVPEPSERALVRLRYGRELPDGAVRYVVRPIEWPWVVGMAAVGLAIVVFASIESGFQWQVAACFSVMPILIAFQSGFDVCVRDHSVRAWTALGPVRYTHFEIARLEVPDVRSVRETDDNDRPVRVTRLFWGSRHLRATLKRDQLTELVAEVARLAKS